MPRLSFALCLLLAAGCQALTPPMVSQPPLAPQMIQPQMQAFAVQPEGILRHRLGLGVFEFAIPLPYPELRTTVEQPPAQVVHVLPAVVSAPAIQCACVPAPTQAIVLPPPLTQTLPPPLAQPNVQPSVQDVCNRLDALMKAAQLQKDAAGCGSKP